MFLLMLTVFALNYRDDSAQLADLIARAEQAERAAAAAKIRSRSSKRKQGHGNGTQEANRLRAQNDALAATPCRSGDGVGA